MSGGEATAASQHHFFGSKYELTERIATGGMAEVFRGVVTRGSAAGRKVAIKRVLPRYSDRREFVMMFLQEARVGAQLSHPNIVEIYDLGRIGGDYFIAMEFVEGQSLKEILLQERRSRRLPSLPVMVKIVSDVAQGLWYAHRATSTRGGHLHIVHRDISPSNILISLRGEVKITDFGLVKAAGALHKTSEGAVKGKYAYMAPEQVRSMKVDHRADLFSLGVVLYECTTGRRIFSARSKAQMISDLKRKEIPLPSRIVPGYPAKLERITMRCLERSRGARYQDARALHQALEAFLTGAGRQCGKNEIAGELRRIFSGTGVQTLPGLELYAEETTHSALASHRQRNHAAPPARRRRGGFMPRETREIAIVLAVIALLTAMTWAIAVWTS